MNSKSILILSLLVNVGLLGAVGYLAKSHAPATLESSSQKNVNTDPVPRIVQRKTVVTVTNQAPAQKIDWRSVESEDYKQYIANLRSVGCPEDTIRDIIIADVNKLFESKKKELKGTKKFEFWKSGNMFAGMVDEEKMKQKQQLAEEKKALLIELLGFAPEEKTENMSAAMMNTMLDFLPDEKQSTVNDLMTKFQAKILKSMKGGAPDAEDLKSIMKIQKEYEGELAKVLTPEEFEDYQLRLSQTSMMMRMQLGAFDPSEKEFRDIFNLRKPFEDEYGFGGSAATTSEDREKMKIAQKELGDKIKEALGEERFADFTRAKEPVYQSLVKIAERNGLPREKANTSYEWINDSKEKIKTLQDDKTLNAVKREEAIKAIQEETQRSLKELLGDKAYSSYTNQPGFSK